MFDGIRVCTSVLRFSALLALKNPARLDRRVAEIAEHTIDAKLIELEIFVDRIASVVGGKSRLLIAKSPSVTEKSGTMRVVDQLRWWKQSSVRFVVRGHAARLGSRTNEQ